MGNGEYWLVYSMISFGLFGGAIARHFGRNPWAWGCACLFLALPGIAALCIAGKSQEARNVERENMHHMRWAALKLVDPEIDDAARKAAAIDREHLLAQIYLAAGDRKYLDAALQAALDKPHREPRFAALFGQGWKNLRA